MIDFTLTWLMVRAQETEWFGLFFPSATDIHCAHFVMLLFLLMERVCFTFLQWYILLTVHFLWNIYYTTASAPVRVRMFVVLCLYACVYVRAHTGSHVCVHACVPSFDASAMPIYRWTDVHSCWRECWCLSRSFRSAAARLEIDWTLERYGWCRHLPRTVLLSYLFTLANIVSWSRALCLMCEMNPALKNCSFHSYIHLYLRTLELDVCSLLCTYYASGNSI